MIDTNTKYQLGFTLAIQAADNNIHYKHIHIENTEERNRIIPNIEYNITKVERPVTYLGTATLAWDKRYI